MLMQQILGTMRPQHSLLLPCGLSLCRHQVPEKRLHKPRLQIQKGHHGTSEKLAARWFVHSISQKLVRTSACSAAILVRYLPPSARSPPTPSSWHRSAPSVRPSRPLHLWQRSPSRLRHSAWRWQQPAAPCTLQMEHAAISNPDKAS